MSDLEREIRGGTHQRPLDTYRREVVSTPLPDQWKGLAAKLRGDCGRKDLGAGAPFSVVGCKTTRSQAAAALDKAAELAAIAEECAEHATRHKRLQAGECPACLTLLRRLASCYVAWTVHGERPKDIEGASNA